MNFKATGFYVIFLSFYVLERKHKTTNTFLPFNKPISLHKM